jgi:hypothetical protein
MSANIQYSPTKRAGGLGAAASASAGSYGETAPCTETAGAALPTLESLDICGLTTGAQQGPSVAPPTHNGVNAGQDDQRVICQPSGKYSERKGGSRRIARAGARGPIEVAAPRVKKFVLSGTPGEVRPRSSGDDDRKHLSHAFKGCCARRARANSISAALILDTPQGSRGAVSCQPHKPHRFYPLEAAHA